MNSSIYSDTITISGRSGGASSVPVNSIARAVADGSFDAPSRCNPDATTSTSSVADSDATLTLYRYTDATIAITSPPTIVSTTPNIVVHSGTVGDGVQRRR